MSPSRRVSAASALLPVSVALLLAPLSLLFIPCLLSVVLCFIAICQSSLGSSNKVHKMKTWEVDVIILCLCGEAPRLLCFEGRQPLGEWSRGQNSPGCHAVPSGTPVG